MQKQDFYALPRSIQDRFIEASQGASAPLPLAFLPRRQNGGLAWGVGALAVAGLWTAFTFYGLGDLSSSFAVSRLSHRAVHGLFGALATYLALRAYARSWVDSQTPYPTGVYLFPGVIVEAKFGQFVFTASSAVSEVRAVGSYVVIKVGSQSYRFPTGSPDLATIAAEKAQIGVERWKASNADDHLERARLNPLVDSGIQNPLAPTQAYPRPRFLSAPILIALSVLVGVGAGFGVAVWRDSLSQKALYRAAISANSVEAYRAYISRGGARPEVKRLLLPRAELEAAISQGSIEAIESFVAKNPNTEISGEVHNAMRLALLVELSKAEKLGTLQALSELPRQYKEHALIKSELDAARHQVYTRALAAFTEKASHSDPSLLPFVERAVAYSEIHGPRVELRISHEFPQEPESLDQVVIKNHRFYMGIKSHPSQYFIGKNARRREQQLLEQVRSHLQSAFPKEILDFELAALPSRQNEELPPITVPTLTFVHREKLSGGYVGGMPKAMYFGAAVTMHAVATMPGDAEPAMRFDWSAWRNPDFSILVDPKKDMPDVYEDMIGGAFSKFTEKYLARWF